jgi:putative transposon-encoded protein
MANVKVFEKWVKLQGQGHKVKNFGTKDLVIRNTHMKYESHITCHSKDMANVKVFEKWAKLQGQGHKVKKFGSNGKVLS